MTAIHVTRLDRLNRLERIIPSARMSVDAYPDGARLLAILEDAYGTAQEKARRRALQRDLDELVKAGRIEILNPGGKPLRYRRVTDVLDDDPAVWQYTMRQIRDLVAEALPERRLDRLWQRLLTEIDEPLLDERRLRIIPDNLRLQPAELYPDVLRAVIESLAKQVALRVLYEDALGVRGEALLHPQALIQRGPIPYLFALKNAEDEPVRLYALHRMIRAEADTTTPARAAEGFDLDESIANGLADFARGDPIDLELRVRGYVARVLSVCPLAPGQEIEDELPDAPFEMRVRARVPSTGQLLRWLLGGGDNIEVIAPAELRQVVASQAAKMAGLYPDTP